MTSGQCQVPIFIVLGGFAGPSPVPSYFSRLYFGQHSTAHKRVDKSKEARRAHELGRDAQSTRGWKKVIAHMGTEEGHKADGVGRRSEKHTGRSQSIQEGQRSIQ